MTNHDASLDRWQGVFPAIPTPFNAHGGVDEDAYRALLEDNIGHGVHGFWNAGGTGEGAIMNDEQRATTAKIAGEVCHGRVLSIMHVGSPTTESSVKAAKIAAGAGCAAVCCVPPVAYICSEASVIEHYQRVADATDLPFFAYNLPQMTQFELLPPFVEKLQRAVPQLIGLKHSAMNFGNLGIFAAMGLKVFTGNGYLLLPALANGGIGIVDAPPSIAPWLYVDIFDAWHAGDLDRARAGQAKTQAVTDLTRSNAAPHHNTKLIIGARVGIDCGEPLRPLNRLDDAQRRALLAEAQTLGLLRPPA